MAVARTYEKFLIDGDPFKENGRMYVYVLAPKGKKKVRWYTDAERARMDKTAGVEVKKDIMDFDGRHAFGFGKAGYITIYKGDESEIADWADANHECTRYNLTFGYYTPSRLTIVNLPSSITPIKLTWEEVMDSGNKMKSHDEVTKYVRKLLTGEQPEFSSVYQGAINSWIERDLVVYAKKKNSTHFGDKFFYTMIDAGGNLYLWETGAKNYAVGASKRLKMKVKEHTEADGILYTVVWYCKEI